MVLISLLAKLRDVRFMSSEKCPFSSDSIQLDFRSKLLSCFKFENESISIFFRFTFLVMSKVWSFGSPSKNLFSNLVIGEELILRYDNVWYDNDEVFYAVIV